MNLGTRAGISRAAATLLNSPLKKSDRYRLLKNDEMQGAQISRNEAYIEYVAVTRDDVTPLA